MTSLAHAPCPRCRSAVSREVLRGRDFLHELPGEPAVAECSQCGFWFQNPRPSPDDLASLYPPDYRPHASGDPAPDGAPVLRASAARYLREHLGYPALPVTLQNRRVDWRAWRIFDPVRRWTAGVGLLPRFVPDGTLLEIGCGNGTRLAGLRGYGWQRLKGIELVPAAAAGAVARGLAVECGPVEALLGAEKPASLDAIVASMVLEHFQDPFEVVRQVAATLKPGGQFLFSTIVRDSLDARMYGKYWSGFDFPRHMVHFKKSDLGAMLAEHFDEVEYFYQWAPIDFVRSASWRRQAGEGRWVDDVITRVLGGAWPMDLPGTALAWIGQTCRVSCRCRRRP